MVVYYFIVFFIRSHIHLVQNQNDRTKIYVMMSFYDPIPVSLFPLPSVPTSFLFLVSPSSISSCRYKQI